jgi:O-antigen/teichoic acid export membrane protein
VAAAGAGFVYTATVTRVLGAEGFASLALATSLVLGASLVSNLGLASVLVRAIARAATQASRQRIDRILTTVAAWSGAGAVAAALVVVALLPMAARSWPALEPLLAWRFPIAAWIVMHAVQRMGSEALRGFKNIGAATFLAGVVTNTVATLLLWFALRTDYGGIDLGAEGLGLVVTAVLTALTVNAVGLAVIVTRERRAVPVDDEPPDEPLRRELAGAGPLLLIGVTGYLLTNADLWIVGAHADAADLGAYSAAQRFILLVSTPLLMVQSVVAPYVASLHHRGRHADIERLIRGAGAIAAVPSLTVVAIAVAAGEQIMAWVFGSGFERGGVVLTILAIGLVASSFVPLTGVSLVMTGHERPLSHATVVIGIATLAVALIAAPRWGAVGVATAFALGRFTQAMVELLLVRHRLGIWAWADVRPQRVLAALRMGDDNS